MKFFYFVSLIASALYLLAFLPKLRTRREPIAYWGCWTIWVLTPFSGPFMVSCITFDVIF